MILVTSVQKLRRLFRKGICFTSAWECEGPCPDFIKSPSVCFKCDDIKYIVFISLRKFNDLKIKLEEDERDADVKISE